jgi:hypothetical protein
LEERFLSLWKVSRVPYWLVGVLEAANTSWKHFSTACCLFLLMFHFGHGKSLTRRGKGSTLLLVFINLATRKRNSLENQTDSLFLSITTVPYWLHSQLRGEIVPSLWKRSKQNKSLSLSYISATVTLSCGVSIFSPLVSCSFFFALIIYQVNTCKFDSQLFLSKLYQESWLLYFLLYYPVPNPELGMGSCTIKYLLLH